MWILLIYLIGALFIIFSNKLELKMSNQIGGRRAATFGERVGLAILWPIAFGYFVWMVLIGRCKVKRTGKK